MAAIYPQCNSTDFAAVTSRLNLAWYFYQEKEQNLKRTYLGSGICFLLSWHKLHFFKLCILQPSVFWYSDSLSGFFFLLPSICNWAYWQLVTCDVFAVLQDCKWLLPWTASLLPVSLAYWVGCFLASERHRRIYRKFFLCIPQPRTLLLLMTSQIMSWTSARQRS